MQERTVIINQMRMLFEQLIALDSIQPQPEPPKEKPGVPVLLTVKECTELNFTSGHGREAAQEFYKKRGAEIYDTNFFRLSLH